MFLTTADGLINSIFKSSADAEYFWRIHYTTVNLFSLLTNTKIFLKNQYVWALRAANVPLWWKMWKNMVCHYYTIPYTEISYDLWIIKLLYFTFFIRTEMYFFAILPQSEDRMANCPFIDLRGRRRQDDL